MEYGDSIEDEAEKVTRVTVSFPGGQLITRKVPTLEHTSEEVPGWPNGISIGDVRNLVAEETATEGCLDLPIFHEGRIITWHVNLRHHLWVEVDGEYPITD